MFGEQLIVTQKYRDLLGLAVCGNAKFEKSISGRGRVALPNGRP